MKIAVYDYQHKIIKNHDVQIIFFISILKIIYDGIPHIWDHFIGGIASFLIFFLIFMCAPNAFGGGDVKLSIGNGMFLGVEAFVNSFVIALFLAAVYIIGAMVRKRITRKSEIPFGPFLCFGAILSKYLM